MASNDVNANIKHEHMTTWRLDTYGINACESMIQGPWGGHILGRLNLSMQSCIPIHTELGSAIKIYADETAHLQSSRKDEGDM